MNIRRSSGFSVMEMLIVLFIIGLILSMVGPRIAKVLMKGNETATETTLRAIKNAIIEYQMDVGTYPKTLQHLVQNVDNNPKWKGSYLEGQSDVPADKWGNALEYHQPPTIFTKEFKFFEIISYGANGRDADQGSYMRQGS